MNHSDNITELAAALAAAQAEMPTVPFDATNPFLRNKYTSLGSVIGASRPVLAKHGLSIAQFPVSCEGLVESEKPEKADKDDIDLVVVKSKRQGVNAIGVETILSHKSGQWMSERFFIPMSTEKGKSNAQMGGSIITYLRRYAWASVLGLYADEDADGNEGPGNAPQGGQRRANDDDGGFDAAQTTKAPEKPASAPKATPPVDDDRAKLAKLVGGNPEFIRCLTHRTNDAGKTALAPGQGLNDLSDAWVKYIIANAGDFMAKVAEWCEKNPATPSTAAEPEAPAGPDAWREFVLPFGDHEGKKLAELPKNYLYGLCMNYEVKTEYNGRPKKPETIAADRKLRAALDAAKEHYQFK